MNLPPTSTQGSANTQALPRDTACDADAPAGQQPRDLFERALRAKARLHEEDETQVPADAALGAIPMPATPAAPLAARAAPSGPEPGAIDAVKTGPQAAIEAALNANPGQHVAPVGGTDPAAVWEVSVSEPNSVAVDVRISRAEKAPNETQANFTVTIGSSTVNAEVLAQHAPRLNERLRKREIGFTHVRIQRDEGDA
jgi:hypothetical protein